MYIPQLGKVFFKNFIPPLVGQSTAPIIFSRLITGAGTGEQGTPNKIIGGASNTSRCANFIFLLQLAVKSKHTNYISLLVSCNRKILENSPSFWGFDLDPPYTAYTFFEKTYCIKLYFEFDCFDCFVANFCSPSRKIVAAHMRRIPFFCRITSPPPDQNVTFQTTITPPGHLTIITLNACSCKTPTLIYGCRRSKLLGDEKCISTPTLLLCSRCSLYNVNIMQATTAKP